MTIYLHRIRLHPFLLALAALLALACSNAIAFLARGAGQPDPKLRENHMLKQAAQPACVSSPAGLTNWWPGEGNAFDIKGAQNGALQNGATFAPGKVGQGFHFDGVNDFVRITTPSLVKGQTEATVDAWVKPLGAPRSQA